MSRNDRQSELHTWDVDLFIDGPVRIRSTLRTQYQKGFRVDDPFYSDVEIRSGGLGGLQATVTARAADQRLAFQAAVFFFGRMLDALTLEVNLPMYLSLTERAPRAREPRAPGHPVRRVIEPEEIERAFRESRRLTQEHPSFLRSLGWYRKGLYTEDPFDRFLACWNAIEIVAARYYRYVAIDKERARKGSRNQVWGCFEALWGPPAQWPIIAGDDGWIKQSNDIRNYIAHGAASVDIKRVAEVTARQEVIERVANRFLADWRERLLAVCQEPPCEDEDEGQGSTVAADCARPASARRGSSTWPARTPWSSPSSSPPSRHQPSGRGRKSRCPR
jgi:hypothetical protein